MTLSAINAIRHAVIGTVPAGARVLAGVSGGPDSVALLSSLVDAGDDMGWEIRVMHVNHLLRREESERDENFVRALAGSLDVPLSVERVDTMAAARDKRISVETAARQVRHQALETALRAWPGDLVALGHTADDQMETLLMHALRGAGLDGLTGMESRSSFIVRPLLSVDRATVIAALQERGIGYRLDSTNAGLEPQRNRIRLELMPVIRAIEPRSRQGLARTARLVQEEARLLVSETERALRLVDAKMVGDEASAALGPTLSLHAAMQRRILRRLLLTVLGHLQDIHESHLDVLIHAMVTRETTRVVGQLPYDIQATVGAGRIAVRRGPAPSPERVSRTRLDVPGVTAIEGGSLTAAYLDDGASLADLLAVRGPNHALLDAGTVEQPLHVRSRRPGDRLHPPGVGGSRKVQDLFVDRKVPLADRDRVPIVEDGAGILWIPGMAVEERATASASSTAVLHLVWTPNFPSYRARMRRF